MFRFGGTVKAGGKEDGSHKYSMSMVFVEQPLALSGSANNLYLKRTLSKAFKFGLYIVLKLNLSVCSFRLTVGLKLEKKRC